MTQISSTFRSTFLSPRTVNYVANLIREGDEFDYCRWLERVREKEAQAKQLRQATTEQIISKEVSAAVSAFGGRETSPNVILFNGQVPISMGMTLSRSKTLHRSSGTRIKERFEKIRYAWDVFRASRARDAVYGYLEVVFAIVVHYKVRRRTKKLLRRAFEFAELPCDKNADPFTAIIRCTCYDDVDNKTISKWARALRYAARCKVPAAQLRIFMKQAGGVNGCADRYTKHLGRGAR
jgi:hypothetical protein